MYPASANTRRMRPSRILLACTVTLLVISAMLGTAGRSSGADTTWTIMVYMANDPTSALPSEDNINAMEAAQHSPGTSIIVLLDEPGDGNSRILDVQHDSNPDQTAIISATVDDHNEVIGPSGEA